MKKIRKLLAYCITLATVMSVIVIPMNVSAEVSQTNLFGKLPVANGTFQTGKSEGSQVALDRGDSAWQKSGTATVTVEDGYLKVENTATGTGLRYNYANAKPRHTYIISAYVKLAGEVTANASIAASNADRNNNSLPTPTSLADKVAISAEKWTYVYGEYAYGAANTADGRTLKGAHYTFDVDAACTYYIKDIQMIDVTKGKNILHAANPGFESGIVDTKSTPNQNGNFTIVTEDKHTGTYSVHGTASGGDTDIRYINYVLPEGKWYRASVYVKSSTQNAKAYVQVKQSGAGGGTIKGSEKKLTGEWDKIELEFMSSDKFNKVHIGPIITNGAEVYVDDFCLEEFNPADKNLADSAQVNDASGKITAVNGEYTTTTNQIKPINVDVEVGATYVYSAKIKTNGETPQEVTATIGLVGSNKNCIGAGLQYSATKSVGNEYVEVFGIVTVVTKDPVDSNDDGVYESGWVDANKDGIPDMLDTNNDGTPETQPTTKFHFQFGTKEAVGMSAKDIQIRKLSAFDLDNSYIGKVINEEGKTKLYITGPASTVYLFGASYGANGIETVIMDKITLNTGNDCCGKLELNANEDYRYFIWDGNLKPLNTVYTVVN